MEWTIKETKQGRKEGSKKRGRGEKLEKKEQGQKGVDKDTQRGTQIDI